MNPQRVIAALPELLEALRRSGFDAAVDQHLSACDLILAFTAEGRYPEPSELRAALGGLFCTNRDQQRRFPKLFDTWYRRLAPRPSPVSPKPVPQERREFMGWLKLTRAGALGIWLSAALIALLATGLIAYFTPQPNDTHPAGAAGRETTPIAVEPPAAPLDLGFLSRPRQTPEPVVPTTEHYPVWASWVREAWLIPAFTWLLWLARRVLLQQVVLQRRRERPGESFRLDQLRLADASGELFTAPALSETWRHLREFRSMQSRRLDEAATVDRTLASGGYFRPVYRDRQVPPAYLLLVDRRHAEDHAAALADELKHAMQRENVQVHTFNYAEDPRFNIPAGQVGMERGPAALAGIYEDHGLLLVGDGDALFDDLTGKRQPWIEEFQRFERCVLLTQEPIWRQGERATVLSESGFRVLPLTASGLAQLQTPCDEVGFDDPRDRPTPQRFAANPARWLEEQAPSRSRVNAALTELEQYLGPEGFLLACATAAYPELHASLTRALDAQLGLSAVDRGLRLRKLARLPWYRAGYMPDYFRIALLRRQRRDEFHINPSVKSWIGHARHADTEGLRRHLFARTIFRRGSGREATSA